MWLRELSAGGFPRVVLVVALAYLCYAALVFVLQRTIIYPGRSIRVDPHPPPGGGREILRLDTVSGSVEGWFIPAAGTASQAPVLIFFHGNGEVIDFLPDQVRELRRIGFHILLVEYPGYGRSEGAPSEAGITTAAVAAYDAVVRRPDVNPQRIVAFGRSLGGGAACALALQRPVAALILQSTFTSTRPFARQFLVPGFLARDVYDNLAALRQFPGPVLVAHGRHDDIIPFRHGKELAKAGKDVRFVELNCSHNDCPPDMDAFWRLVGEWLKSKKIIL